MKRILILFSLAASLVLAVPLLAQVAGCPAGQHGICLAWTPSTSGSATTTTALRGLTPGGEVIGTYVCTVPQATASCLDQSGLPGITYYYKVAAWSDGGPPNGMESAFSNEANTIFPTAPASPTALTATPQ